MRELIGKKINAIFVSDGEDLLVFDTDGGLIGYETYGDCCSETWFADIDGVKTLLGATVESSNEVSLDGYNSDDGRCRQMEDEVYGVKLITNKGYADIIFRNSSNGYYGGSIGKISVLDTEGLKPITDDWSA